MSETREVAEQLVVKIKADSKHAPVSDEAIIDRIDAALKQAIADEREAKWLPIESAPKDGRAVHLGFQHMQGFDVIAHWSDGDWSLTGDGEYAARLHGRPEPSHWRPLPPAPAIIRNRREEMMASQFALHAARQFADKTVEIIGAVGILEVGVVANTLDKELAEVREVLDELRWQTTETEPCWCRVRVNGIHDEHCQRARALYEKMVVK